MPAYILSIDQGTTSTRAIIFDAQGRAISMAQRQLKQIYPADGWVEHKPEEIWQACIEVCRQALKTAVLQASDIATMGITNQRETTLIWHRKTGRPLHNAIVWQDRRTASRCEALKAAGGEALIQAKTGLLLDPYFSATKIAWILDNTEGARAQAERGELAFGTIDSFLLWHLTAGKSHKTDATNASRTCLFNIHSQQWDDELLALFNVPHSLLPTVEDCAADFGHSEASLFASPIPIGAMAGDQQAALVGQACTRPGMIKSTYGTGCFMMLNTGTKALKSKQRLLSTVAYRLKGKTCYALEGSIFMAGAAVQWLRDGLGIIDSAAATEALARQADPEHKVYLVPAFTGLGAPYWDPDARGALFGLRRDTRGKEIVAATLQAVAYQSKDLIDAMQRDADIKVKSLRVDGGMVANNYLMDFTCDLLNIDIQRSALNETTALGVAYLAGLQAGIYDSLDALAAHWHCEHEFKPDMSASRREQLYSGWIDAVSRTRSQSLSSDK
ncbi:MAG: glycerol kinase GlpK [Gammaproteobacteria bacterium]|nr:glycerol kinase GlpK [Gammaproteobacteria bacterium]MBQ0840634.1 glycerol kinase GlpK [Gammaproteobacteria bacterium]